MASASTSVGPFTLKAMTQYPDDTIIYTLDTPDGPAVIGTASQIAGGASTAGHVPGNSALTIVRVGQAEYELTNEEAATLLSSFGQMYQTVNSSIQTQLTTVPAPTATNSTTDLNVISTPPKASTTSTTSTISTDLNAISSPPKLTVTSVDQASANGTASLNVIATAPGAPSPTDTTPSAISAIISDEPLSIDQAALDAQISATLADMPMPDLSVIDIASMQDSTQFDARSDWRVRLSYSPDCNYLYRSSSPGILAPLSPKSNGGTDGVIFPYTPMISVNYAATYDQTNITHSNYKVNQYASSSVDSVTITGDFTAQDTREANYLLAVIHFFRTMTKMFYGQDQNPKRGTPPPLCYLFGMGTFQFSAHPLAITGFSYNLPNDVDYIKTVAPYSPGAQQPSTGTNTTPARMAGLPVAPGGKAKSPEYSKLSTNQNNEVTWVPTKIQLAITCIPMQSRNQVSNKFSLEKYATGDLLNGIKNPGGAFW